jgi:hypothetical protein
MTLPLFSEFLSYAGSDTDTTQQDCELKAFKRLAVNIKQEFPQLPLMILLDGLYASGPVFDLWISGKPLTVQNVHERCHLGARFRWGIEDSHHTEKRRGYCTSLSFLITGQRCAAFTLCCVWPISFMR